MQQEETAQILSSNYNLISKKGNTIMKNLKRIISLVIVAMMLVAIAVIPASAAETRASQCDICGSSNTTITKYYDYGAWKTVGSYPCIHYAYGTDAKQEATRKVDVRCMSCGGTYVAIQAKYRRATCHGYDSK